MGLTRADLIGDMSDEERASRREWIDRCASNDIWANKIFRKVGILLTGHQGNRPFMKSCIESHAKLGLWITLAYDNFIDPTWSMAEFSYDRFMPAKDVIDKVDMFIMPHHQIWGGVLYPYFWLLKFGVAAMMNFEYIYCTNSDFVIEKPEGFWDLFLTMGDADVMTCGHDEVGRYANTAGFFIKTKALLDVVRHWQDHFVPFEKYEQYTQEYGNAEGRFGRAIADLQLKQVMVDPPADDMLRVPGKGVWFEKIGFRHIHSELNHAYRQKGIPPPLSYLDERYLSNHDIDHLKRYEENKDVSVLETWWAKE